MQPRRFYIRVFLLLSYLSATANEHYQSGFKVFHLVELHFVWPLSAELSGMRNPTRDYFFSGQYSSTGHGGAQTFPTG